MTWEDISKIAKKHGTKPTKSEKVASIPNVPETKEGILEEFREILLNFPKEVELEEVGQEINELYETLRKAIWRI